MPCWAECGEDVPGGVVTRTEDCGREEACGSHGSKFIWFDHRLERECLESGKISQD